MMRRQTVAAVVILVILVVVVACIVVFAAARRKARRSLPDQIADCQTFIYSIAWEDPRLDFRHLKICPRDTVLMITTGGCNVLNTLLHEPARIVSVDMSKCQNALLDIKLAAIQSVPYADFWKLFGLGRHRDIRALYARRLRPRLQLATSRAFWDANLHIFRKGLYRVGKASQLAELCRYLMRGQIDTLTRFDNVEDQYAYYKTAIEPYAFNCLTRYFIKDIAVNVAGVPESQMHITCGGRCRPDQFFHRVKDMYDHILKTFLISTDNYFFYGTLTGQFSRQNCPAYLKRHNYAILRRNVHKVQLETTTVTRYLREHPTMFTKFILLDHMDWFEKDFELFEEFHYIRKRSLPGSEGIFRSGSARPWIVDALQTRGYVRLHDLSFESKNDRLGTYPGFYKFIIAS